MVVATGFVSSYVSVCFSLMSYEFRLYRVIDCSDLKIVKRSGLYEEAAKNQRWGKVEKAVGLICQVQPKTRESGT